ncbi:AraC family transcriptional regulator [Bermanella marisrubri]|uniref:Probable transcriptional regulator n=1 Tax=Bermanella marisrubri TaxID=207949 RepID=Q1N6M1_9GAMM|nr:AraC family transcriptional regulator [Bermanella marisrubri]EAT13571.1 probable transcriptional regulator [Oceanobacter sp. RED65] [Bermanella marisrubri]QIZ84362.1 AraC family transcriptional regulator [Bermanella marisrubri]
MERPNLSLDLHPKIAVQPVRALINYAERHGLKRSQLLEQGSLSESQLNDSRLLIDVMRFEALMHFVSGQICDEHLGFHLGQQFEPDRWGILGLIALTCPNVMAALDAQYRFQSLSGNMGAPMLSADESKSILQWVPAYDCSHNVSEMIIAGLVSLTRVLINQPDYSPIKVTFTHSVAGNVAEYSEYFGCPVEFSSQSNSLEIDNGLLQSPLRHGDGETYQILMQHAKSLLTQQSFSSPLEVIKDFLLKTLPDHVPDIEEVAEYMGMSVRSTQRKLSEFGTSYSQVLDGIRKELAMTYLKQTQNPMIFISERLGFSEQSAFQRAFKRWTGVTPKQFRTMRH